MNMGLKCSLSASICGYSYPNWREGLGITALCSPIFSRDQKLLDNWLKSCFMDWSGLFFVISSSIKQVKGLELIPGVTFAFGSCCCEPTTCSRRSTQCMRNMPSKAAFISVWEIARTLGVAKSTVWYILRKTTMNKKRPGHPRKTTVVDDHMILSILNKNLFTTSSQVKNTLQDYSKEKTSLEQIQRVHHTVQTIYNSK